MKIFVSSLIAGMEPIRAAARDAVILLGHQPIMAEDFGALPHSPQVACLSGVRQAGAVVLVLGARYGVVQPSGLSATHEEYREAKERCPILAFVEDGVSPEAPQAKFIQEVQAWDSGLIRVGFSGPDDLKAKVVQALNRMEVSAASAPFDPGEVLNRALALFPSERSSYYQGGATLFVGIAGGPAQPILRPSQIEDSALADELLQAALFGQARIFDRGQGNMTSIKEGALVLEQSGRTTRSLWLDAQGSVLIRLPVEKGVEGYPVILVETVQEQLAAALRYADWLLGRIDPTQRLSPVVPAIQLLGGISLRTRREHEASPNTISVSYGSENRSPVHLTPAHFARAVLRQDIGRLIEDLSVLLRRQWR